MTEVTEDRGEVTAFPPGGYFVNGKKGSFMAFSGGIESLRRMFPNKIDEQLQDIFK